MEDAVFCFRDGWEPYLCPETQRTRQAKELMGIRWGLLALTAEGCGALRHGVVFCKELLMPGTCDPVCLRQIKTAQIITYGLSRRDSITLSSLQEPMLCIQRTLTRMDGSIIEPQEILLPKLPLPPEEILLLFGLKLLQKPLGNQENFSILQ